MALKAGIHLVNKRHSFYSRAILHGVVSLFNFASSIHYSWTFEEQPIKQHVGGFLKLLFEGPIL